MPRGPAPSWRRRKEPVLDAWVLASVEKSGGIGKHHPKTGHYAEMIIKDLTSREEAEEYRRGLFRCAHYLNRTGQAPVSMNAKIEKDGRKFLIRFKAVDKTLARQHVLDRYGPDRSKWPYDPRRRGQA